MANCLDLYASSSTALLYNLTLVTKIPRPQWPHLQNGDDPWLEPHVRLLALSANYIMLIIKLYSIRPILPRMNTTWGRTRMTFIQAVSPVGLGAVTHKDNLISSSCFSTVWLPSHTPTFAATKLPNSGIQRRPTLINSSPIRSEKWGFIRLGWDLRQQMWPQTCPQLCPPTKCLQTAEPSAGIFCLIRSHYPAGLDLPGFCSSVCLLNFLPHPPWWEMTAYKTTGNYGPFMRPGLS